MSSKLPDDLSRFLFLVPHVAQREDGVPVDELCSMLSMSAAALHSLIERVAMVGTPDGSPDEMVDVYLEGDRVFVALPQRFTRPPRFTVEEMLALLVALAPLREGDLPALRAQAESLTNRLLSLASERAGTVATTLKERVVIRADGAEAASHLRDLETAVSERRSVDAEYYTAGRDALTTRVIEPVGLLQVRGAWYVVGSDGKTFKVERFRAVRLRDDVFDPPDVDLAGLRRRLEARQIEGEKKRLTLRTFQGDREISASSMHAIRRWVRSSRGSTSVIAPPAARADVAREARELLARYQDDQT